MKQEQLVRACSILRGDEKCIKRLVGKPKRTDHSGDLDIDVKIYLREIMLKGVKV
jgi:hypothetical protein